MHALHSVDHLPVLSHKPRPSVLVSSFSLSLSVRFCVERPVDPGGATGGSRVEGYVTEPRVIFIVIYICVYIYVCVCIWTL